MDHEIPTDQLNEIEILPTKISSIDVTKIAVREDDVVVINYPTSGLQPYTHVKYKNEEAVLYPIRQDHCAILLLQGRSLDIILRSPTYHSKATSIKDCLKYWSLNIKGRVYDMTIEEFSMKPSLLIGSSNKPFMDDASDFDDPKMFLDDRYYSVLYSFTVPLTYFPKTTLPRVRVLSQKRGDQVGAILRRRLLNIAEMDERHEGKFGCLKHVGAGFDCKYSAKFCQQVSKIEATEQVSPEEKKALEQKINKIVADVKFRETCLQLLLLLEILVVVQVDEEEFLNSNAKLLEKEEKRKERASRKRLIRSGTKRKIVPTFLGMGGEVRLLSTSLICTQSDQFEWFLSINAHIDRLLLWDALEAQGGVSESRVFQYLGYVIVPYFKRLLPKVVDFIVQKIKAGTVKLPKHRSKPKLERSGKQSKSPKPTVSKAANKYSSRVMHDRPTLARSLNTDPFPSLPLKRTSSGLTSSMSTRQLEKRQIDFSVKRLKSMIGTKSTRLPSPESCTVRQSSSFSRSSQALFGERRKRTIDKPLVQQIMATPVKVKSNNTENASSPSRSSLLDRLLTASEQHVDLSPIKVASATLLPFKTPQKLQPFEREELAGSPVIIESSPITSSRPSPYNSAVIKETPPSKSKISFRTLATDSPSKNSRKESNRGSKSYVEVTSPFYSIDDDND